MLTYDEIVLAHKAVKERVFLTPCRKSTVLSDILGTRVYLKLDNHQITGSFKERGAINKLISLTDEERAAGVIAASAGNHAQAVAYHGSQLGIDTKIVMPEGTPLIKVTRTKNFGGQVVLHGTNYDEAYERACEIQQEEGRVFVHPFNDPAIMAGQGTMGIEIFEQQPDLETVVVAIGGGGLASGIAVALKTLNPAIRIIGVEPEVLPSMKCAVEAGEPVEIEGAQTLADGVAVRKVGELTTKVVSEYVDEIVTVSENEIAASILLLLEQEKTLAEGAGAASLAAILGKKFEFHEDEKICAIICGGNIDVNVISRIIERGLAAAGRIHRVAVLIKDTPGTLAGLLKLVGKEKANVLEVLHNRTFTSGEAFGSTHIELKIETRGEEHIWEIRAAIAEAGYHVLDRL